MEAQGLAVRTKVLSLDTGVENREARSRLNLEPSIGITRLQRLRTLNGKPVIYQESFMSDVYGQLLNKRELENSSLYAVLLKKFGLEIVRAEETLRAVELREEAKILKRKPGSAAFLSIRATIGEQDRCVLLDRALLPGDSTEVKADRLADRHHVLYRIDSSAR
jgi:GntR family transcriptional regulator